MNESDTATRSDRGSVNPLRETQSIKLTLPEGCVFRMAGITAASQVLLRVGSCSSCGAFKCEVRREDSQFLGGIRKK